MCRHTYERLPLITDARREGRPGAIKTDNGVHWAFSWAVRWRSANRLGDERASRLASVKSMLRLSWSIGHCAREP